MNVIAFIVPGKAQSKERSRSTASGHHYTPHRTAAYESLVRLSAAAAMGAARPFSGPLAVEIEVIHSVPASWPKKRQKAALDGTLHHTSKPDVDNCLKSIADGGNGVIWGDDRQIVSAMVTKRYGERPEVRVRVAMLDV